MRSASFNFLSLLTTLILYHNWGGKSIGFRKFGVLHKNFQQQQYLFGIPCLVNDCPPFLQLTCIFRDFCNDLFFIYFQNKILYIVNIMRRIGAILWYSRHCGKYWHCQYIIMYSIEDRKGVRFPALSYYFFLIFFFCI